MKRRLGQKLPRGDWAEVVALVDAAKASTPEAAAKLLAAYGETPVRLALGVFTPEADFARLRVLVKRLAHAGWTAWEAADLAGLHMLRAAGIEDITADWTLYAFNSAALAELSAMGVRRFVASPENCRENLVYLAESGYDVEFLVQQTTPLFISLHRPLVQAADENAEIDLKDSCGESLFARHSGALWTTAMSRPRTFNPPSAHSSVRIDLSWDREEAL